MLDYTVCFIKHNSQILLLNRDFPSWMGAWNGVGGKLEDQETPRESVIREIYEETGIKISKPIFKGITSWFVGSKFVGGMYVYSAEQPPGIDFTTPKKTYEGILDWKEYDWIMHPKNLGIASDIPKTLTQILFDTNIYEHRCFYEEGKLVKHKLIEISPDCELFANKKLIEENLKSSEVEDGSGIR